MFSNSLNIEFAFPRQSSNVFLRTENNWKKRGSRLKFTDERRSKTVFHFDASFTCEAIAFSRLHQRHSALNNHSFGVKNISADRRWKPQVWKRSSPHLICILLKHILILSSTAISVVLTTSWLKGTMKMDDKCFSSSKKVQVAFEIPSQPGMT